MKWVTWLRAEWDRVAGFGLVALGALFLLLGYLGVRNTPFVAEQMAYIASGGLGGLFCLGFGVGLLLTADLHDEWRKLDRLEAELRGLVVPEPEAEPESVHLPADDADAGPVDPASGNGTHGREPVPQAAGAAGALAVALTRPSGGTRQALAVVSLVLLLPLTIAGAGWRWASQTADMDVAARGLGLAVAAAAGGLVLIALWALWMRISVLRRRAVVTGRLRRWNLHRLAVTAVGRGRRVEADADAVFMVAGHRRFHRRGCPMLEWVEAVALPRERLSADLSPCGLCDTP